MNNPCARVYENIIFRAKIGIPTISGSMNLVIHNLAEMCYLDRRTRLLTVSFVRWGFLIQEADHEKTQPKFGFSRKILANPLK